MLACSSMVVFAIVISYCPSRAVEITRVLKLHEHYQVAWKADLRQQNITFRITANTLGFVCFGLSQNGGWNNADLVIGGLRDGKPYFSDYHGNGDSIPEVDESQNWHLLFASENETHTTLVVTRPLNTCDPDDRPINNDTIKFIWSVGANDEIGHHEEEGAASVIILDPKAPETNMTGSDVWRVHVKTELPARHTTYWCSAHKSPPFTTKRHMVGFKINFETAETKAQIHHLILHRCRGSTSEEIELYEQILKTSGGLCYEDALIWEMKSTCEQYVYGWAVGASPLFLPENIGVPLNEFGKPEYFVLEVHYDNPKNLSGLKFETEIEIHSTNQIREHDAGVLRIGHEVNFRLMIPPNTANYTIAGHCGRTCTQDRLPEEGITVFTSFLHAHIAGRKMKLRQFRNGVELPWLSYDDNYDFNFQQNRLLAEYRKIIPGDHLTYECTDDSSDRSPPEAVLGGLSTRKEMCFAFLMYYPRLKDFDYCGSDFGEIHVLLTKLGIGKIDEDDLDPLVKAPPEYANKLYSEVLSDLIPWNDTLRLEVQNLTRFGEHIGKCEPHSYNNNKNNDVTVVYPEHIPYIPIDRCARGNTGDVGLTKAVV